jgi:hypothetical protein
VFISIHGGLPPHHRRLTGAIAIVKADAQDVFVAFDQLKEVQLRTVEAREVGGLSGRKGHWAG